jgi:hypothetical protein
MHPVTILIDADACPVKDEIYRVAERFRAEVRVVSNAPFRIPDSPRVKRVVVSTNPAPHRNPPSPRLRIATRWVSVPAGATDAVCVPEDGAPLRLGPGAVVTLTPDPDESWRERYTVLTSDGRFETREEQGYYSWYATGGSLRGLTRSPLRDNEWTLPTRPPARGTHSLWVLLRDGHGGASGCRVDLEVAP